MSDFGVIVLPVMLASVFLGLAGGLVGSITLLQRRSLFADAISHAAFPGIVLAFLIIGKREMLIMTLGAFLTGVIGAYAVSSITKYSHIKQDAALGIILANFYAFGVVLLGVAQKMPVSFQSGLNNYLVGQIVAVLKNDLWFMTAVSLAVSIIVFLFFKEIQLFIFDKYTLEVLGFKISYLDIGLVFLMVLTVIVGIYTSGVVLVVGSFVIPGAIGRLWSDKFTYMLAIAGFVGAVSGVVGVYISSLAPRLPTGPLIVVVSGIFLLFSLLFASKGGIIKEFILIKSMKRKVTEENIIKHLYLVNEEQLDEGYQQLGVPFTYLLGALSTTPFRLNRSLKRLARKGYITYSDNKAIVLSEKGYEEARGIVRRHRLWETYLFNRLSLPDTHLHDDAEMVEHLLTREDEEVLDKILNFPKFDPHGRKIPREV